MAEYKVGDSVLIKATVVEVPHSLPNGGETKLYGLALYNSNDPTDDGRRIWAHLNEITTQEELRNEKH